MVEPAFEGLLAPQDPRADWGLPSFGALPWVTDIEELATRVLAPNPSPMTLDGTNTYVVGALGSGGAVVVDPGPDDDEHRARVDATLADRDVTPALVLVTHHHRDHAEAAQRWAASWGCRVAAAWRSVAGEAGRVLGDREMVAAAGTTITTVATPGHASDHLAFRLESGSLLTGDHVLGRGTSVVAHPDGDLAAYLESLRRVLDLGADALLPGHGPVLDEDTGAVLDYYLEHRAFRSEQIRACLADGPHTPRQLVERIYAEVDRRLWPAAEASTRAALDVLEAEGTLVDDGTSVALSP